jgi:hypothetical protein
MQTFLTITNTITVGNIAAAGTIIAFLFYIYWKLKRTWFDYQQEYLRHIKDLTDNQTTLLQAATDAQTQHIENCIHKLPEHPENPIFDPGSPMGNETNGTKVP